MPSTKMPGFLARVAEKWLRPLLVRLPRLRNRQLLVADVVALSLTPFIALLLRLDHPEGALTWAGGTLVYVLLAVPVRTAGSFFFGLYRRYWRFATVDDLTVIVLSVGATTGLLTALTTIWTASGSYPGYLPRSLPLIDGMLALAVVGGVRFSARLAERLLRPGHHQNASRVLICGAGVAGQLIVRELQANPELGLFPVAFLDDDAHKQGVHISSLPVLGTRQDLKDVVRRYNISQAIIAMPRAPGKIIREFVQRCEEAGIPARTVPGMYEIIGGAVSVSNLRKVEIEDLLRREPIQTDIAAVRELVRSKRVLITGAGGSIGSELCRQVLQCGPSHLALVGHGENSVFEIHAELQKSPTAQSAGKSSGTAIECFIADIRFASRVQRVIEEFRPDIIFHAAAHKHVPLMELNPVEAITNNVFGTRNLLNAALACSVEHFVMISTDKAVNPTSVMGASKRAAELLVLRAARRSGRPYVAVRFGNVLGSRGSVVLTFKKQISQGGPVTVSHPDMKRYFMTIPEAVQLVLQASVLGRGGEIFVLDMGEPVKVVDLAKDLIELSGLEVGQDIDIVYTGIRPGEKLFEELFIPGEDYGKTHHEKVLIARNSSAFVPREMDLVLERLGEAVEQSNHLAVLRLLQELIPEYRSLTLANLEAQGRAGSVAEPDTRGPGDTGRSATSPAGATIP